MLKYDPQSAGPQYLEDIATGYWAAEVLFTAVEMELFSYLAPQGKSLTEVAAYLKCQSQGLQRYLQALCALGLITVYDQVYYNTKLAADYLIKDAEDYQGDSILWRKYLGSYWQDLRPCLEQGGRVTYGDLDEDSESLNKRIRKYIKAMDNVARTKVKEIVPFFTGLELQGNLLDVGTGSGAVAAGFLEAFPGLQATLLDIDGVLPCTSELIQERGLQERVQYCPTNILEKWSIAKAEFDLVMLSNIVHAYSEAEITGILAEASQALKAEGFLIIHDFFLEHYQPKASLLDLNMFINTYNGKVFAAKWIQEVLVSQGLFVTELIPLASDTAVLIAAKQEIKLEQLQWKPVDRLAAKLKTLGFKRVYQIVPEQVKVPDWTAEKCRFGCSSYGEPHCPPNSPSAEQTRRVLQDYSQAFILEGEPPTQTFQRLVVEAEKLAFKAGYHKAFAYWAGPCSLCTVCTTNGECKNTKEARPSMEAAGIDVFETVRNVGVPLRTLSSGDDFVKYFGLLLLE